MVTNAFQLAGAIMTLLTALAAGTYIQMPKGWRKYIFEQHDKVNKKSAKVACFSLIGLFFILVGYFIPTISETGDFWIFTLSNKGWITGLIFFLLVVLLVIIGILIANKWVSRKYS